MKRWTGALGILISVLFVISLSVTSHLIVTGLGAAGEGAALGAPEPPLGASEVTQEVAPLELPPTLPPDGVVELPTDDTHICSYYPDEVSTSKDGERPGQRHNLYVGYEGDSPALPGPGEWRLPLTGDNMWIYLRFDLSWIESADDVDNAFLMLWNEYSPSSGYPLPRIPKDLWLRAYKVDNDNWQESTLTWNKAIENHQSGDNVTPTLHLTSDNEKVWVGWDVTDYVKAEVADDKITSFCIRDNVGADENSVSFESKDSEDWPENKVHLYIVGPEAAGVAVTTVIPKYRVGMPEGTVYFKDIIVKNMGSMDDNYDLSVSDNTGWGAGNLGVSPSTVGPLSPGESAWVTAWATIPLGTAYGAVNNITVTATSKKNENVRDNDSWEARVAADRLGPTEDDSWVTDNAPDNNYSYDDWMRLESWSGDSKNARVFLKYDLSGITPENQIAKAELYIWCWVAEYDDVDAQIYSVDDDAWVEENITWNNQPSLGDVLDTTTLTSWPENVADSWISWDVTPYVAGQRLTNNIASFCIRAEVENTSGRYQFDGKDWQYENEHPYLEITLGPDSRDVSVSISPVHRIGHPYDTVTYEVKVMNTGNVMDNYDLTISDNAGWSLALPENRFENVKPGESRNATLSVTLDNTQGAEDSIQVTASGTGVSDNENCTASVKRVGGWEVAGYAPRIDNYGVAVTGVGSGSYIYVANSNTLGTRVSFMRYDTDTGEWDYRAAPPVSSPFKNGTVLAWDGGDYIYALCGGSYDDVAENSRARHYFFRYKISTNTWENLRPTGNTDNENNNLGAQGAGDAMVVAGGYVYAIVGQNEIDSTFWVYEIATNNWEEGTRPWESTDDGCSLVWTGGAYLYALRGEWHETSPSKSFSEYLIVGDIWSPLEDIPEPGGVGDGASLLWIGGDNIYATGGSRAYELAATEGLDDNFYVYSISGDSWTQLEDLPAGIGAQNGPRLGAGSDIYAWRGCESDSVLWVYATWTGTADFSLVNLYTVNVEKILDLGQGSKLVVKFYTYGDSFENENVIETFSTLPWNVEDNELARHPGIGGVDKGVQKARLDLTADDTSDVISTIASYTVRRVDLETRFSKIPSEWFLALPPERTVLETEFSKIPSAWFLAPS